MARPVVSQAAEDLYVSLLPLAYADAQYDWPLLKYCEANAGLLQEVKTYTDLNGTPPWSSIVDVERAPFKALPWLGQLAGQISPNRQVGETDQQYEDRLRQYIRDTPGFKRGSPGGMAAAAQQFLTGTKTVYFRERDTSPYHLTINTRKLETPVEDWAATNILPNGGFEASVANWGTTNCSNLATQAGLPARFGTYYGLHTSSAAGAFGPNSTGTISGATLGRIFTASVYVRGTGVTIGKTFTLTINETGGASGTAGNSGTVTLSADWQRISVTRTLTANDRTGVQLVPSVTAAAAGEVFHLDGAQVEENQLATPYIETNSGPVSRAAGNGPIGAALRAQKPAGIIMVYATITGQDWQNVVNTYATWTAVAAAYATINALENG